MRISSFLYPSFITPRMMGVVAIAAVGASFILSAPIAVSILLSPYLYAATRQTYKVGKRLLNTSVSSSQRPFVPTSDRKTTPVGNKTGNEVVDSMVEKLRSMKMNVTTDWKSAQEVIDNLPEQYDSLRNRIIKGFVHQGVIYLNPDTVSADTPLHEFTHVWAEALRQNNSEEWQHIKALMKSETQIWNEVVSSYPHLATDDEIADEVLATYSGLHGAELLEERIQKGESTKDAFANLKEALSEFWKNIAGFFGVHYTSKEDIANRVLYDFLQGINPARYIDENKISMSDIVPLGRIFPETSSKENPDKQKTVQGLEHYSEKEIIEIVKDYVDEVFRDNDILASVKEITVIGSRTRDESKEDSDIDILLEYSGDEWKEDEIYNLLHDEDKPLEIDGIKVDINPINPHYTLSSKEWLERDARWREEDKLKAKQNIDKRNELLTKTEEEKTMNPDEKKKDELEKIIDINRHGRKDVFEPVIEIPVGYFVWPIGRENFPHECCVPLVKRGKAEYEWQQPVDLSSMKYIKVDSEETALKIFNEAIKHGCDRDKFNEIVASASRQSSLQQIHSFIKSHSGNDSSRTVVFLQEPFKEAPGVSIVGISVTPDNIEEDGVYYNIDGALKFLEFQFDYSDEGEQKTFNLVKQEKVNQLHDSILKMTLENKFVPIIVSDGEDGSIKAATFPQKISDEIAESLKHHPSVLDVSHEHDVVMAAPTKENSRGFMSEIVYALRYASLSIMEERDRQQHQGGGMHR